MGQSVKGYQNPSLISHLKPIFDFYRHNLSLNICSPENNKLP